MTNRKQYLAGALCATAIAVAGSLSFIPAYAASSSPETTIYSAKTAHKYHCTYYGSYWYCTLIEPSITQPVPITATISPVAPSKTPSSTESQPRATPSPTAPEISPGPTTPEISPSLTLSPTKPYPTVPVPSWPIPTTPAPVPVITVPSDLVPFPTDASLVPRFTEVGGSETNTSTANPSRSYHAEPLPVSTAIVQPAPAPEALIPTKPESRPSIQTTSSVAVQSTHESAAGTPGAILPQNEVQNVAAASKPSALDRLLATGSPLEQGATVVLFLAAAGGAAAVLRTVKKS